MSISEKCFNEVIELVEEYINELKAATVNRAFDKRVDQFNKADDKEREEFNKILQIEDRDKRAKAYKEFDKKANDRFDNETKKIDKYYNYALRHPEIIEAVEKYVDNDGNTHELEFSANKNKYKFDHKINGKSVVLAVNSEPNANYERKHAIKNYGLKKVEEALSLMEEIINEVSIGALARATENNAAKRKEDAKKSEEGAKKAWASYNKLSQEHPEDESALYRAATNLGKVAYRDDQRKEHVEDLEKLNLPKDSKVSANKLFKAADKSYDKRADEYDKFLDSGESRGKSYKETKESRPAKRYTRVARLSFAEPVKSRVHEALDEAIRIFSEITEADHHANKKNPVVKITDRNYKVASGKSLPGPFNKNHVGNYIVYNKDTDASYLVTPDNWKKSKIKKDLESQGKFYEALEEAIKILEGLFIDDGRGDILDDITGEKMTGIQRIRKGLQKVIGNRKKAKK